jgi:hypothetical protein
VSSFPARATSARAVTALEGGVWKKRISEPEPARIPSEGPVNLRGHGEKDGPIDLLTLRAATSAGR